MKTTNVISLLGMKRICETTIAKSTIYDIKTMCNVSCFIKSVKDSNDSNEISCKILEQFKKNLSLRAWKKHNIS